MSNLVERLWNQNANESILYDEEFGDMRERIDKPWKRKRDIGRLKIHWDKGSNDR